MHIEQRDKCKPSEATPNWIRTAGLYMPGCKAEAMTAVELRRGLCAKSGGNWHVCLDCPGGCTIGRRLAAIMRGEVAEPSVEDRNVYTPQTYGAQAEKPTGKAVDGRMKFSPEKWKEIVKEIKQEVKAGTPFNAACGGRGIKPGTVRNYLRSHGMACPQNGDRAGAIQKAVAAGVVARRNEAIQKAAKALAALEQGRSKAQAARAAGYSRWYSVQRVIDTYRDAVEEAAEK